MVWTRVNISGMEDAQSLYLEGTRREDSPMRLTFGNSRYDVHWLQALRPGVEEWLEIHSPGQWMYLINFHGDHHDGVIGGTWAEIAFRDPRHAVLFKLRWA